MYIFSISESMIPEKFSIRRKSVFAEAYNPEEDDDDTIKVISNFMFVKLGCLLFIKRRQTYL